MGDAQLVWRGKDTQDWSDLIVNVPPLDIQQKIHPKAIIDDLKCRAALEGSGGKGGVAIAPLDLMIAAHAMAIDATLVSADQALSMIDILKVEDWSV